MMKRTRSGFTLLELLLALALTATLAVLIGGLVQLYLVNETRGRESVRQAQLARAILNMIAEDIRTTVRHQKYDTSALQQMLSGASGGMGGGMGGGGGGGAMGGGASGGAGGSVAIGGMGGSSSGSAGSSGAASGSTTTAPPPPGIYGSSTSIEIDVSRLPRPDEYIYRQADLSRGTMGDMPSDIKTIGYYIQSPRADGVQDPLAKLTSQTTTSGSSSTAMNGGLVRRSVDRSLTQYAYNLGRTDQLMRTGEIVAPEVLAIEFQYYDGTMWQTQWDGSQLGLPRVVRITIAMQSETMARTKPLTPGMSISSINTGMIKDYGVLIYSINTIIPGSQLLVAPSSSSTTGSSGNGMSSVGL